MSVKKDLLETLEKNRGKYCSGEELAQLFQVSRAAIWKAVGQLKQEGYEIKAVQNKGYFLEENCDLISEQGIRAALKEECQTIPIVIKKEMTSTNIEAKQAAALKPIHGMLFVAEQQTAGRGRRGRSFVTLKGKGIYMSLVLCPDVQSSDVIYLTTAASVAVVRAIQKLTGIETGIKWVNDIYKNGKKLCGILSEAVTDCESGQIDSIVVGIGINFSIDTQTIPEELKHIETALYEEDKEDIKGITRNQLIAEVVNQMLSLCKELSSHSFITEYKEHSILLGKEIDVIDGENQKRAKAVDIDEQGGLVVEYPDGKRQILHTGEVSIRKCS